MMKESSEEAIYHRRSSPKLSHSISSIDKDILERQDKFSDVKGYREGFIARLDIEGNVSTVPVSYNDDSNMSPLEDEKNKSIADFVSTELLTKPFQFVSGNANKVRFNPFRKKSGLLNVLTRQGVRNRMVGKNGKYNTNLKSMRKKHRFVKDFFTTLLRINWFWTFLYFAAAFFISWLFFALIWYWTLLVHGDFDVEYLTANNITPCVDNIQDFTSCFLFSLETQHTIGYGGRATTEQCPFAIIIMSFQSIIGVIIQSCMAGIVFAKFTLPTQRQETIIFSKNAVVTLRNGSLYLLWRLADLQKSTLVEAHVRTILVQRETTEEGEIIPYQQQDLLCGSDIEGSNERVFLMSPATISHKIDSSSPLYNFSPRELLTSHLEIICILEGTTEETGNSIQVRTSYMPNEILWGHRFDNSTMAYNKQIGVYQVDHNVINYSSVDQTPKCSARVLEEKGRRQSVGRKMSSS